MKNVRRSFSLSALCLAFACMLLGVMSNQTAKAQGAAPPIGYWNNQGKTNSLVVEQNGTCGFLVNGKAKWSGTCRWETPSARGGILASSTRCLSSPGTFVGVLSTLTRGPSRLTERRSTSRRIRVQPSAEYPDPVLTTPPNSNKCKPALEFPNDFALIEDGPLLRIPFTERSLSD